MDILVKCLLVFAFLGFVVFCFRYFRYSDWTSTPIGKNAMAFMAICALLLGLGIARRFTSGVWFERHGDVLGAVSYGLISAVVWWRVVLLIRAQRRPPRG